MAEPVEWLPDGTPRSPRFGDIYRSRSGGLEQSQHVFLGGCGLPQAWAGRRQWRILETGFGLGMNFLAVWRQWKDDPQRPGMLHFASCEAWPVCQDDLMRGAAPYPQLAPLARELAAQWIGLTSGTHRLAFENGRVLLTLCVGDVHDALAEDAFDADSVFLDGFDPERNPQMWDPPLFEAVASRCRPGTMLASWTVAAQVRDGLSRCGFSVEKVAGLAPKRHAMRARYTALPDEHSRMHRREGASGECVVVGAGLAGSAVAASLARRGWAVTVLDAAPHPAAGASGLPAGLMAPHHSADDNVLSRLTRAGVRITLQQARELLRMDIDWGPAGVLEHRPGRIGSSRTASPEEMSWTREADAAHRDAASLGPQAFALWHELAAWVKPSALVHGWLSTPGLRFMGGCRVGKLETDGTTWRVLTEDGSQLARADLVVLAAAIGTADISPVPISLHSVRGQVSWGMHDGTLEAPPFPANGNGHFIPRVPVGDQLAWFCGSTYGRDDLELDARAGDHTANLEHLEALLPATAAALAPAFRAGHVHAWTQLRCVSRDRRPLAGELAPGLWVSAALGSRGLTFAALCAEMIAARLHAEPLPMDARLARALDPRRA